MPDRQKRKIVATILLLTLVLLMSGCGQQPQEITEITFIHGWGSTEADHERMRQIYRDFEVENPDIRINLISMPTSEEVIRKTEDMIMVGMIPDLVFLGGRGVDSIYQYMVNNDCALDLMPYLLADQEFYNDLAPVNLEYWLTEDGALYSVSDVLILGGGYWYNKDIFKAAGITVLPKTWNEFESACDAIERWAEEENNGVHALQLSAEGYMYLADQILADHGTSILDRQVPVSAEELLPVFSILERIHNYSLGEDGNYTYRDETSQFNAGKLGIYFNGVWGSAMIAEELNVSYALFPAETTSICCESAGAGYVVGRTSNSAQQEASVRFVKYMMSQQVQERILLETQQMPANPNICIDDYSELMPRFAQAVVTAQQAEIKIEIPNQLWSNQQMRTFTKNIFSVLSGKLNKQTFVDLLR